MHLCWQVLTLDGIFWQNSPNSFSFFNKKQGPKLLDGWQKSAKKLLNTLILVQHNFCLLCIDSHTQRRFLHSRAHGRAGLVSLQIMPTLISTTVTKHPLRERRWPFSLPLTGGPAPLAPQPRRGPRRDAAPGAGGGPRPHLPRPRPHRPTPAARRLPPLLRSRSVALCVRGTGPLRVRRGGPVSAALGQVGTGTRSPSHYRYCRPRGNKTGQRRTALKAHPSFVVIAMKSVIVS